MNKIIVNSEKCNSCGLCAIDCPMGIIEFSKKDNLPQIQQDMEESCIQCGHCEAICPKAAITVDIPDAMEILFKEELSSIPPEHLANHIRRRRSIRHYENKVIDKKSLENLMDIVRFAPTGINAQSVNWLIVYNSEKVAQIAESIINWLKFLVKEESPLFEMMPIEKFIEAWDNGFDPICRKAPHLVITHGHKENPISLIDSTIAMTHLDLTAPAFGFGTCWAGFVYFASLHWEPLKEMIGIPQDHIITGSLMLGYPKYTYHQIPKRKPAKITWL